MVNGAFFVVLIHWGLVTHICLSELTIIASNNGLSPGWRQAIIWNNDGLLLIEPLGTNFCEISIRIQTFSFKKMHLNMSSAKWHPFCLGLNVLTLISVLPLSPSCWLWCHVVCYIGPNYNTHLCDMCSCNTISFLPNPHNSSSVRARYGVSFVSSNSEICSLTHENLKVLRFKTSCI